MMLNKNKKERKVGIIYLIGGVISFLMGSLIRFYAQLINYFFPVIEIFEIWFVGTMLIVFFFMSLVAFFTLFFERDKRSKK